MKKLAITTALVGAMAFVGTASADELTQDVDITVNVSASCAFELDTTSINDTLGNTDDGEGGMFWKYGVVQSIVSTIECNKGLPYTLDIAGVDASGFDSLPGANTGEQLPIGFTVSEDFGDTSTPLGDRDNMAGYEGVGSGENQSVSILIGINDYNYDGYITKPSIDTYHKTYSFRLTF